MVEQVRGSLHHTECHILRDGGSACIVSVPDGKINISRSIHGGCCSAHPDSAALIIGGRNITDQLLAEVINFIPEYPAMIVIHITMTGIGNIYDTIGDEQTSTL